ncbi:MAG: NAD(+)/NADH kinase, partial [Bacteroidales bacterium]
MKIAIFAREISDKWKKRFLDILKELSSRGAELSFYRPFYLTIGEFENKENLNGTMFTCDQDLSRDTDIFLCFGGDGTFLESLTIVKDKNIPVAGINFGRLGFLTSVDSVLGNEWIERLFAGNYKVEKRGVLSVESNAIPQGFCKYALNEVAFQ